MPAFHLSSLGHALFHSRLPDQRCSHILEQDPVHGPVDFQASGVDQAFPRIDLILPHHNWIRFVEEFRIPFQTALRYFPDPVYD